MGLGIKQYVTQLRVLKACEMLAAEPELKIEAVGLSVGSGMWPTSIAPSWLASG